MAADISDKTIGPTTEKLSSNTPNGDDGSVSEIVAFWGETKE